MPGATKGKSLPNPLVDQSIFVKVLFWIFSGNFPFVFTGDQIEHHERNRTDCIYACM
jgi:hypothetical protein